MHSSLTFLVSLEVPLDGISNYEIVFVSNLAEHMTFACSYCQSQPRNFGSYQEAAPNDFGLGLIGLVQLLHSQYMSEAARYVTYQLHCQTDPCAVVFECSLHPSD
jgi:hypothetical protein